MLSWKVFEKPVNWISFAPDDSAILVCGDLEGMKLLDGFTGEERWAASKKAARFWRGMFTPDGRHTVGWEEGQVVVRDAADGKFLKRVRHSISVFALLDDRFLITVTYGMDTASMRGVDLEGNVVWTKTLRYMGGINQLCLSPDRKHLVGINDLECLFFDVATRKLRARFPRDRSATSCGLSFSPDSRWFVYASHPHLHVVDTGTAQVATAAVHEGKPIQEIALTPDGRHLFTVDLSEDVTQWDTQTWQPARRYTWDVGPLISVAVSHDGCRAAVGSNTGTVLLWDLAD